MKKVFFVCALALFGLVACADNKSEATTEVGTAQDSAVVVEDTTATVAPVDTVALEADIVKE